MPTLINRCISLLLILMLVVSLIPSVYAAETADEADPAASTETTEETTNTEPEENMIPPPDETELSISEESGTNQTELDIIDDSEPPVMLLIDGEVALASISNCQATTWATIWVNTDEYSPIAGKSNDHFCGCIGFLVGLGPDIVSSDFQSIQPTASIPDSHRLSGTGRANGR